MLHCTTSWRLYDKNAFWRAVTLPPPIIKCKWKVGGEAAREISRLRYPLQCYSSRRMKTLNERFSLLSMRRRYEVWFLRLGLNDGSGAWWFRYLLMNPGRGGCAGDPQGQPAQVWATWFPREGKPETWIQGFPLERLRSKGQDLNGPGSSDVGSHSAGSNNPRLRNAGLSKRGASPFFLALGDNRIGENECHGRIDAAGQRISWDLRYRSSFRTELSSKGWIGFSRTPHSNAAVSV